MNGNIKRVLKAPTKPILNLASLQDRLPLYASDKEDGIRCVIHPIFGPVSQKMLPIPNKYVRECLRDPMLKHLDGELVALDCEGNTADYNDTQSRIMSHLGCPMFEFRVFDWFGNQYAPYRERLTRVISIIERFQDKTLDTYITYLSQTFCREIEVLEWLELDALERNKEGLMLRHPDGWYKEGRSTLNEAYLLKVKRFTDSEAIVIGLEEEMENCNAATLDAGGLQKRSKHQVGMKGKDCVGALICDWQGKEIRIASGLTAEQKFHFWLTSSLIIGKTISFKYQLHGMKRGGLPRCPVFKGIRYD